MKLNLKKKKNCEICYFHSIVEINLIPIISAMPNYQLFDHSHCTVAAKSLGLPYLSAYLDSLGTNFSHGANFATSASTIRLPTNIIPAGGFSPFYLHIQYSKQFVQFKSRSQMIRKKGKFSNNKL